VFHELVKIVELALTYAVEARLHVNPEMLVAV
jgi:hypothetical protein